MLQDKLIIAIDSSELDDLMLCPRRWALRHKYHLKSSMSVYALDRGTLLHDCLKEYYKAKMEGMQEQLAIENAIEIAREKSIKLEGLNPGECSEVYFQFREYCRYYEENGEQFYPISIEEPFVKQIYEDEQLIVAIQGIIDYIGMYNGTENRIIMDHKGISKRQEYSRLRNQFKIYAIAADIDTVVVNKIGFQKTLPPAERFSRQTLTYYPSELAEQKEVIVSYVKMLQVYMDNDFFPPNFTSCDKWSGCTYEKTFCSKRVEAREYAIGSELIVGEEWDVGKLLEEK